MKRPLTAWSSIRRRQAIADWRKIMLTYRQQADDEDRAGQRAAAKTSRALVRLAWRRLQKLTTR